MLKKLFFAFINSAGLTNEIKILFIIFVRKIINAQYKLISGENLRS